MSQARSVKTTNKHMSMVLFAALFIFQVDARCPRQQNVAARGSRMKQCFSPAKVVYLRWSGIAVNQVESTVLVDPVLSTGECTQ